MATPIRLTITGLAASIDRQYGAKIPAWKLRRVLDSMDASGAIELQRVANYRTVSGDTVGRVADELQRLGWLSIGDAAPC